jgi:hypothetical protein
MGFLSIGNMGRVSGWIKEGREHVCSTQIRVSPEKPTEVVGVVQFRVIADSFANGVAEYLGGQGRGFRRAVVVTDAAVLGPSEIINQSHEVSAIR